MCVMSACHVLTNTFIFNLFVPGAGCEYTLG
jgi:hypothetical protein